MKLYRIAHADGPRWAREVSPGELDLLSAPPFARITASGERLPLAGAALLAPASPTKIVAIGRNYRAHAQELGNEVPKEPLLFLKPPSALLAPGGVIRLPAESQR